MMKMRKPLNENFKVKTSKKITPINFFKKKKSNRFFSFHRQYTIQEVIKKNQVILIQIVKEERGNKVQQLQLDYHWLEDIAF